MIYSVPFKEIKSCNPERELKLTNFTNKLEDKLISNVLSVPMIR